MIPTLPWPMLARLQECLLPPVPVTAMGMTKGMSLGRHSVWGWEPGSTCRSAWALMFAKRVMRKQSRPPERDSKRPTE